jgi:hypothetical protein
MLRPAGRAVGRGGEYPGRDEDEDRDEHDGDSQAV